jgi:riboflavin kinase/FMN adenylyltransferase
MRIYRSFEEIKYDKKTILTVGTFDGVHKGHKAILRRLINDAEKSGLRDLVMTFHPHPQQVVKRRDKIMIELLTTIDERIELFEKNGISNVLIIPFTYQFSQTPPDVFIREMIVGKVGVSKILIGYDHMFGRNREGDLSLLKAQGERFDFEVEKLDARQEKNLIISSTKIRIALKSKDLQLANELLGYNYSAQGTVIEGDRRGRTIGYLTANIQLDDNAKLLPADGVYFVKVYLDGESYYGMTNIGMRPTFDNDIGRTFETYIFDFDSDIYGKKLKVEFLEFIRDELKFDNIEQLIAQLKKDEEKCRKKIKN